MSSKNNRKTRGYACPPRARTLDSDCVFRRRRLSMQASSWSGKRGETGTNSFCALPPTVYGSPPVRWPPAACGSVFFRQILRFKMRTSRRPASLHRWSNWGSPGSLSGRKTIIASLVLIDRHQPCGMVTTARPSPTIAHVPAPGC